LDSDGYWCLLIDGRPFDEVAEQLGDCDGMRVIVFHSDEEEEFEWDGVIRRRAYESGPRWAAKVDDATFRRLR
jgi:hypothetical protein